MISVIFDFDGVLVDSRPTIGNCLIDALGEFGISAPSPLETSLLVGPPLELGLTEFLTQRGISLEGLPEIISRFRDSYAVKSIQSTFLFPGIREMLESLYSENISMYIARSTARVSVVSGMYACARCRNWAEQRFLGVSDLVYPFGIFA